MFSKKTFPENELLNEYLNFLRDYQCLSEATVVIRRNFLTPFLMKQGLTLSSQLHLLAAKNIHDYIIEVAPPLHRASKKQLTSSIRSFLRFAYIKGYLQHSLVEVVPVITSRKQDRLPESISWENIQQLLTLPDKNTPTGRRDLAVMMLCIHYGVRIGQVTTLKLSDIHWKKRVLSVLQAANGATPYVYHCTKASRRLCLTTSKRIGKILISRRCF